MKFNVRNIDRGDNPSRPLGRARARVRLARGLKCTGEAPWSLFYDHLAHQERASAWDAAGRALNAIGRGATDRVVVLPDSGDRWAVRKDVEHTPPAPDGPGTRGIDIIVAATTAEAERRGWRVINMGICVDKPGEHGHCNAWDARYGGETAEEIHRRIEAIARWKMEQGKLWHRDRLAGVEPAHRRGLPVNGVIWLTSYWEAGNDGPRAYSGTPHVFHDHVSAWPSITGWV